MSAALHWLDTSAGSENICSRGLQKMKTHKIFIGALLLAFVFTVALLPATPASAIIGGQPE
jgi:hypothetical protein